MKKPVVPFETLIGVAFGTGFEQVVLRIEADVCSISLLRQSRNPSRKLVFDQTTGANSSAIDQSRRMMMFLAGNWML